MEKFKWALNPAKLQRALANIQAKVGPKPTEKDIMDLYVSYGGLVDESNMHSIEVEAVKVAEEKKVAEVVATNNEAKKLFEEGSGEDVLPEETNDTTDNTEDNNAVEEE